VYLSKDLFTGTEPLDPLLFTFTFMKAGENCLLKAGNLAADRTGDTIVFTRIEAQPVDVLYEKSELCANSDEILVPSLSQPAVDIRYSADSVLSVNSTTGEISFAGKPAGRYTIHFASSYCLQNNADTIIIVPPPSFSIETSRKICAGTVIELMPVAETGEWFSWSDGSDTRSISVTQPGEYTVTAKNEYGCTRSETVHVDLKTIAVEELDTKVTDADCYLPGKVDINTLLVMNAALPLQYHLENEVTGEILRETDSLREGDYLLAVEDADGCHTHAQNTISVRKNCLNDYPVFSPNTDGRDDDYFIPYEGEAIVYDRNGIVRNKFTAPAYWDGTDSNGNALPMGTYLILVGKKEVINITIIK